jgi:hypothetical protein
MHCDWYQLRQPSNESEMACLARSTWVVSAIVVLSVCHLHFPARIITSAVNEVTFAGRTRTSTYVMRGKFVECDIPVGFFPAAGFGFPQPRPRGMFAGA